MKIIVEGAEGLGDVVEGGFERFRSGSHDRLYGGGVRRFRKTKNPLQIRACSLDAVGCEHLARCQKVVLNYGFARNTERVFPG
jgi:hypothetical protein